MKKILVIIGAYTPGYKVGGPIQSIRGFGWLLKSKYDVRVLTQDRDYNEKKSYDITRKVWHQVEETKVMYVTPKDFNSGTFLKNHFLKEKYDLIYLQGYFSNYTRKILLIKKLNLIKNIKIFVAVRGEFGEGALEKNKIKKRLYVKLMNLFKINKKIIWHATNVEEESNIKKIISNPKIHILDNVKKIDISKEKILKKELNEVKLIFISRIVEHKNLYFLLDIIEKLQDKNYKICLDIYGPLENEEYWKKCEKKIFEISENKNIKIKYNGSLKNEEVIKNIRNYHYLVLPTKGENFGHIIMEAFIAKTPVVISDKTPWRSLSDKNMGYDISLENRELWISIMEKIIKQTDDQYKHQICSIKNYCDKNFDIDRKRDEYLNALEEIFRGESNNV